MMKISVLTLFPEYFEPLMTTSILKRAKEKELFEFETIDFRKFTKEKHGHVDDTPYGGGAGMVLMCQPILDALESIRTEDSTVILLTPQGKTFNQQIAKEFSLKDHLIFICGSYFIIIYEYLLTTYGLKSTLPLFSTNISELI